MEKSSQKFALPTYTCHFYKTDFKNIFADKFSENIGVFYSNYC
jgi:hypothetical protein